MWIGAGGQVRFGVLLVFLSILSVKGADTFFFWSFRNHVQCGYKKTIEPALVNEYAREGCRKIIAHGDPLSYVNSPQNGYFNRQKKYNFPEPYKGAHFISNDEPLYTVKIKRNKLFRFTKYVVIFSWSKTSNFCKAKGVEYDPGMRKGKFLCVELRPEQTDTEKKI
ncbi:hypothetical protein GcM1_148001 [Golovinomyces cichoracearum]|uniref:Uncharacterized protein n=1 Tax=Golovinomyces cichoracearum TaxID=62708 RepID=A0A420JB26_9PEZI|nr:hypothetical protein GcM1_148001 [Golovinomyces cichoracearum]